MRNKAHLMKLLILLLCIALVILPSTAWAQEGSGGESSGDAVAEEVTESQQQSAETQAVEATNEDETSQRGISILFLLIGAFGIFVVFVGRLGSRNVVGLIEDINEAGSKLQS